MFRRQVVSSGHTSISGSDGKPSTSSGRISGATDGTGSRSSSNATTASTTGLSLASVAEVLDWTRLSPIQQTIGILVSAGWKQHQIAEHLGMATPAVTKEVAGLRRWVVAEALQLEELPPGLRERLAARHEARATEGLGAG